MKKIILVFVGFFILTAPFAFLSSQNDMLKAKQQEQVILLDKQRELIRVLESLVEVQDQNIQIQQKIIELTQPEWTTKNLMEDLPTSSKKQLSWR